MRRRYENLSATAGPDGWSRWVTPNPKSYRTSCCDCGLVHDLQFRMRKRHVEVRFKRNNRATAAVRRASQKIHTN